MKSDHHCIAAGTLRAWLAAAILMAMAIFALEGFSGGVVDFPALYVLPVMVASISVNRASIIVAATVSAALLTAACIFRAASGGMAHAALLLSVGLAALALATGIMLRALAATSLAASQARLLDETHDSVTVRALDGRVTYWNRASSAIYGWRADEAIGTPLHDLLHTRSSSVMDDILSDVLSEGSWEGELVNRTKDGREIVLEARLAIVRDARGRPSAILETARDMTQRRRADEELRFNEARYRGIFQTMGVAYWEMDFSLVKARCDGLWHNGVRDFAAYLRDHPMFTRECIELSRPRDVNATSVRLFGASDARDLMARFGECWPAEGEPVFAGAMLAALSNTAVFETPAVLRGLDGRRLEVHFAVSYPPGSETRDSIVVAIVDLAESNRAKAELKAAQDDLAHAMRLSSLGILTATIAHEVNQPLGGVIANARAGLRWLRRETPALAEVDLSVEQILSEAKRAAGVLSRIRAMARKTDPEPMALELNELVEETMALLAGELRNGRVELRMRLQRLSPFVVADRVQVQQVIINLALNSIYAMAEIDERPRVLTIGSSDDGSMAAIFVDDTGMGIGPEHVDQLFTPFFTTKSHGLGVGLSVCGNIIERHSGRIAAVAKETPGFCVTFTLPLADP